jgi:hypothetical protein
VLALLVCAAAVAAAGSTLAGRSVQGRPIRALRVGSPRAPIRVLVVGAIHGDELAGEAIVRRLRRAHPPRDVQLWLVDTVNPDGAAARRRQNAHGVDLNRNFPVGWRGGGRPFDTYYPGPHPLSEPESRAAAALIRRLRPRITVWYHQHLGIVVRGGGDLALQRLYSRRSGLRLRRLPHYPGTATGWQNHEFPGDTAMVVELPAGRISPREVARHAGAVLALARAVAPPRIHWRPIPYGAARREEMRRYALRHYGIHDYRLTNPHVIVEHYTDGDSFASAFSEFAQDVPDQELHELPATCAHFVVDRDGTIYQLVSLHLMCRHTVGLNWTAVGIEHVGRSDAQVMADRRQRRSSLLLTRWLQGRLNITTRDVIGHNESLSSPYHRERVAALRGQTHGDFRRSTMSRYRRALSRLPRPASVR